MDNQRRLEQLAHNLLFVSADLVPHRGKNRHSIASEFRSAIKGEKNVRLRIAGYRTAIQQAIGELVSQRGLAEPVAERERRELTEKYLPPELNYVEETGSV